VNDGIVAPIGDTGYGVSGGKETHESASWRGWRGLRPSVSAVASAAAVKAGAVRPRKALREASGGASGESGRCRCRSVAAATRHRSSRRAAKQGPARRPRESHARDRMSGLRASVIVGAVASRTLPPVTRADATTPASTNTSAFSSHARKALPMALRAPRSASLSPACQSLDHSLAVLQRVQVANARI